MKALLEILKALYSIKDAIKGESGEGDNEQKDLTWYDFFSIITDKVPVFAGSGGNIVNLKELSLSEELPSQSWLYYEQSYGSQNPPRFTSCQYENNVVAFYGGNNVEYEQEINGKTYYYYQTD